jgi:hypothetical protein
MILDDNEYFKVVTTLSKTLCPLFVSGNSDYMDQGVRGGFTNGHKKRYLNILGITDITSTGADNITFYLYSASNTTFNSNKTAEYTSAAIEATDVKGKVIKVVLPEDMYRYIRIEWVITAVGTVSAGGTFNAFISEE